MKFNEKQSEILINGFQQNDFTQGISGEFTLTDEYAQTYSDLRKKVLGYMKNNLSELGIKRSTENFSSNHPVNLLMNTDASYIAEKAAQIYEDKKQRHSAIRQFFTMFSPLIRTATKSYCKAKGKTLFTLTKDDRRCIMDRVVKVVNEELLSAVMQGQQFTALNDIAHQAQTHEDFEHSHNTDAINFYNQWTHCKTTVGAMLSLDDEEDQVDEPNYDYDTDILFQIMRNSFCETLDDTDVKIFCMREDGFTHSQIAETLGYKTHSAVTKRLQSMRERWDKFMLEHEPQQ